VDAVAVDHVRLVDGVCAQPPPTLDDDRVLAFEGDLELLARG
jgi:hypothetical protein